MGTNYYYISKYVTIVNFYINLMFTILTFYLMKKIKKKNGYVSIVYYLTISQFMFELGSILFFSLDLDYNIVIKNFILNFIILSGDLLSSLYAFCLCNILCYVVITRKYLDISYYKNSINFIFVLLVYIIQGLSFYFQLNDNLDAVTVLFSIYNWIRIIIPFIIIIELSYVKFILISMKLAHNHPLNVLFNKLFIYPIVAVISRLPIWFFQYKYQISNNLYAYVQNPTLLMNILYFIAIITFPSAGIGNFYAFYINNIGSYKILKCLFTYKEYFDDDIERESNIRGSINVKANRMSNIIDNDRDYKLTDDDFDIDNFEMYDNNFDELDEEQLCRYIALFIKKENKDSDYIIRNLKDDSLNLNVESSMHQL